MLFLVREPAARAHSIWLWSTGNGVETLSFAEAVELERRGVERTSPLGPGREDARPKPDPDGVLTFIRRWNLAKDRTLMIGDFHFDVLTGAAAGVPTALITNGMPPSSALRFPAGHPSHVMHALPELVRYF